MTRVFKISWDQKPLVGPCVLAMGNFDGVHLGHKLIIDSLKKCIDKTGLPGLVLTYDPHPQYYLNSKQFLALTSSEEKNRLLSVYGASDIYMMQFDEHLRLIEAPEYLENFILPHFQPRCIVIGSNHRFGKEGKGNVALVSETCKKYNIHLQEVQLNNTSQGTISSSKIRSALIEGNLEEAVKLLGHPFEYSGHVESGEQIGRTLGFPTANLSLPAPPKLLLPPGVYGGRVTTQENTYFGLVSTGFRPTFQGKTYKIEVHLLDFTGNLYGQNLRVELNFRLRPEIRFEGKNELVRQMHQDKQDFIKKAPAFWPSERN